MIYQNDIYPLVSDIVDKFSDLNQLVNNASFKLDTLNQISNNTSFKLDTLNQLVNSASFKLDVSNQIASASSYKLDSLIQIGNISSYKLDMLYQGMDELNTHLDILALNAINNDNNNFTQMANLYINGVNALISGLNTWDKLDNITLLNAFLLKMTSQIFEAINTKGSEINSILVSSNAVVVSAISTFYKTLMGEVLKSNNYLQSLAAMNLMEVNLLGNISTSMIGLGQGGSGGESSGMLDIVDGITTGLLVESAASAASGAAATGLAVAGAVTGPVGLLVAGLVSAGFSIYGHYKEGKEQEKIAEQQEAARLEMANKQADMMNNLGFMLDPNTNATTRDEAYSKIVNSTLGTEGTSTTGMGSSTTSIPDLEATLPAIEYYSPPVQKPHPMEEGLPGFAQYDGQTTLPVQIANNTIDELYFDKIYDEPSSSNKVNSMLDETDVPNFGGNINNNESKTEQPAIAPNITINFGDVHETVDLDVVVEYLRKILVEEMGKTPEGVYYA